MNSPAFAFRTAAAAGLLFTAACATTGMPYASGVSTIDLDVARPGPVSGIGIESHDIVAMTDRMMRDMLANPILVDGVIARQVIVDDTYFINESSQRIDKRLITDRLRVNLNRAAAGRMVFVGRANATMVSEERELKRAGIVGGATLAATQAQAGGDYRLSGRIGSLDARDSRTGMVQRFTQITFEMIDLETGVIVWSGIYDMGRAAANDVVYR